METLARAANRGSVPTGYDIDNSLKLNSANSEYLYQTRDTSGSDWNRLKWTASMWVKHIPTPDSNVNPKERMFGAADANSDFDIRFRGEPLGFRNNSDVDGAAELRTTALYRDYSAWYHVVAVWDTANATAGDRMRLYVNGEEVTDFSVDTQPSLNAKSIWGKKNDGTDGNVTHTIGAFYNYYSGFSQGFNGYMAEIHWVEGQALTPTDFGVYDNDSGIWKPKAYTGSYGTNGFYLDFSNASNLGADASGNGNDWTLNNITSADQATDTPTNNFCTINPLIPYYGSVSEGATKFLHTSSNGWESFVATMGAGASGKWYAEFKFVDSDNDNMIGICPIDDPDLNRGGASFAYYGSDTSLDESVGYYASDGSKFIGGGPSSYGNSWARTNIMSIAVDMDNGKLYFAKDGVWQNSGDPTSGATGTGALDVRGATKPQSLGAGNFYANESILANYGGFTTISISSAATDANGYGTFEYAPPSGYYALCTKNLAEYG